MMKSKFLWALLCGLLMQAAAEAQPQKPQQKADSLLLVQVRVLSDSLADLQANHASLLEQQQNQALRIETLEGDSFPSMLAGLGILFGILGLGLAWKTTQALERLRKAQKQPAPSPPASNGEEYKRQLDDLRGQFHELKKAFERQQAASAGQKQTEQFVQPQAEASGTMPSAHEEIGQTVLLHHLPEGMEVEAMGKAGEQSPAVPVYLQKPMADGSFMPYREMRGNASYFELNTHDLSFSLLADSEVFDRIRKTGITAILPDTVAQLQEGSMEHWKTLETIAPGKLAQRADGMLEIVEKLIYKTKN